MTTLHILQESKSAVLYFSALYSEALTQVIVDIITRQRELKF